MYDQFKPKHHQEVCMNQSTLTDAIYYNNFNYKAATKDDCVYSTPNSISCDSQSSSRLSSPTLGYSMPVAGSTTTAGSYSNYYDDAAHHHMDIDQIDFFAKDSFDKIQSAEEMSYEQPRVNRGGRKQVKVGTTKRNARERNRVRFINDCFEVLREHIPLELVGDLKNQKLSKVDTLKYAAIYIQLLGELLESDKEACPSVKVKAESEVPSEQVSSVKKRAKVEAHLNEQPKSSSISITNINININEPRINAVSGVVNHQQSVYVNDQYSPCSTSSSSSSSASSTCSNSYQHQQSQQYYHQNFMYQANQSCMNYQSYMAPAYAKPAHDLVYSQPASSSYYPNHCSKSFIINSFLNNAQANCQYSLT